MGGTFADFLSNLNAIHQKIIDLIDKENAKNLKTFLECLSLIDPVFGQFANFLIPEENEIEKVLKRIEEGFKEVNDNLKKVEHELKMELETLKVFTAMSHIKTGYDDVVQMETSANPDSWS